MFVEASADYATIEKAIRYLEQNYREQPDLKKVADHVGLSEYHFQRLFTRWAGISPKRFVQTLTLQHAKQLLNESQSVLDTTYDAGLSSPGRLHDLFITHEAITPGEYKQQGAGLTIQYGIHETPFGPALLGMTARGICHLAFVPDEDNDKAVQDLATAWPQAQLEPNQEATRPLMAQIFSQSQSRRDKPLHLLLKGTNFQVRVWSALLQLPAGTAVSYGDLARMIGKPQAQRAVGTAVGRNPIAYLIPCHRVIRQVGEFGSYQWGATRKKAILGWEAARFGNQ